MAISMAKLRLQLTRNLLYFVLVILTIACVIPFYMMVINGTRSTQEINTGVTLIPGSNVISNLEVILTITSHINFFMGFLNSAIVAVSATALSCYIGALTAFSFAFYEFPLKKILFAIILASIMIPPQLGIFGYFDLMLHLNLLDTLWSLILPAGAPAFIVFFLCQYTKSVLPRYIIEAARIDGARVMTIFHRIALPIMSPGIAIMAILGFIFTWNSYFFPLIMLTSPENYTLPLMMFHLNSALFARDSGAIYLAIGLSILPILVMFAFFQKFLIAGVTTGSLKE